MSDNMVEIILTSWYKRFYANCEDRERNSLLRTYVNRIV